MKQHSKRDIFVIGFALFSMFFGAGNVLFPPYLGMSAGPKWVLGFICYYIADIGLALLALFSIFRRGSSQDIVRPIGKIPSTILFCAIVLCIGPMLAIPRTAATTFELGIQPLTGGVNSVVFSILFFVLVFVCTVRENKVVDIVGKLMTPLLLIGLVILITVGIVRPIGPVGDAPQSLNVAADGIKNGYQTMDVLATMLFGILMLRTVEHKGYTEPHEKFSVSLKASLVAGVTMLIIYGGLTWLGASVATRFDLSAGRADVILSIVEELLGHTGTVIFAVVVALACLTTAIGLVSSCADFFADLFKNRVGYKGFVVIICVFSAVVSNVGLDRIISIAAPILDVVYPPTLALIVLSYFRGIDKLTCRFAAAGALVISFLTALSVYFGVSMPFLRYLPFDSLGFGWLVPSAVLALIGWFINRGTSKKNSAAAG